MRQVVNILLIAATTLLAASCQRRDLDDACQQTALIPVEIDWSLSDVPMATMHRASVLLFPTEGGAPLEYFLEENLTNKMIEVPVGNYAVVVFNETATPTDWQGLYFSDAENYSTFAAHATPLDQRGFYLRSRLASLASNPDPLAGWNLENFEVTQDMIILSRNGDNYRTRDERIYALTHVQPLPYTQHLRIIAHVTNLHSAMQITGLVDGIAEGTHMASGRKHTTAVSHAVLLSQRTFAPNGKDGTVQTSLLVFGKRPLSDARYHLSLDFILQDGTPLPTYNFDVTKKMEHVVNNTMTIELGLAGEDPILLPDLEIIGDGIIVGDWEDVTIPLN